MEAISQISSDLEVANQKVREQCFPRFRITLTVRCFEDYLPGLPGYCASRVLRDPTVWLGVFGGGFLTAFLMIYRIRGSIVIGVFLVAIISWPRDTAVTYFPRTEAGDDLFAFFKEAVTFRPLQKVGAAIDVSCLPFTLSETCSLFNAIVVEL